MENTKTMYFEGIWDSVKWEDATEILKRKYDMSNIEDLFSFSDRVKASIMMTELTKKFGEDITYDLFIPSIQSLAYTSHSIIKKKIPILTQHSEEIIELTQHQGACIFATIFLCMFGNESYGLPSELLDRMGKEGRHVPFLSFASYLQSNHEIFVSKTLYYIRYFLKMAIRMALAKTLCFVSHASYFSSEELLKEKLTIWKDDIQKVYNVDREFELDREAKNSILRIGLSEFDPLIANKKHSMTISKNKMRDEMDSEFYTCLSSMEHMHRIVNKKDKDSIRIISGSDRKAKFFSKDTVKFPALREVASNILGKQGDIVDKSFFENCVIHTGSLSSQENTITTNFANKILGGGCMEGGCVQEEILVLVAPEIMIARMFVVEMTHIQSIYMSGYEVFSYSEGYGFSLRYGGVRICKTTFESDSYKSLMIAVDAIPMMSSWEYQFCPTMTLREFIKIFTGLQANGKPHKFGAIATGKWGCGVFGGHIWMKFLIQLIACAFMNIEMNFSCFQSEKEMEIAKAFLKEMVEYSANNKVTKGDLFNALIGMEIKESDMEGDKLLYIFLKTLGKI